MLWGHDTCTWRPAVPGKVVYWCSRVSIYEEVQNVDRRRRDNVSVQDSKYHPCGKRKTIAAGLRAESRINAEHVNILVAVWRNICKEFGGADIGREDCCKVVAAYSGKINDDRRHRCGLMGGHPCATDVPLIGAGASQATTTWTSGELQGGPSKPKKLGARKKILNPRGRVRKPQKACCVPVERHTSPHTPTDTPAPPMFLLGAGVL